jgi:hypothetical protein
LQVDDRAVVEEPSHSLVRCAGEPFDPARTYRVALVRNLLVGLDHVEPLERWAKEHPEAVPPAGSGRAIKIALVDAFSIAIWRSLGGFDRVDANHDDVIDESELEAAIARVQGQPPSALTAGLVMHALDANHDEKVSREEAGAVDDRVEKR